VGTLEAGKIADLSLWDAAHPADLSYNIGLNPCAGVMAAGEWRGQPEFLR
jgi:imidazolonepropionase